MMEILKIIGYIIGGIAIALIFSWVKGKIFKQAKGIVLASIPEEEKTKLLDLYAKGLVELKQLTKLGIQLPVVEPSKIYEDQTASQKLGHDLGAMKWISNWIRTGTLLLLIVGVVYAVGFWKGKITLPIHVGGVEGLVGKFIPIDHGFLTFKANGEVHIVDADKKTILKVIKAKDLPELRKALKPFSLQLKPIGVIGAGMGSSGMGFESGAGVSWLRYFKWNLDSFFTNRAFYPLGCSYKITNNSALGASAGIGYKGDQRAILYYRFEF
jgi:hypothetical protein